MKFRLSAKRVSRAIPTITAVRGRGITSENEARHSNSIIPSTNGNHTVFLQYLEQITPPHSRTHSYSLFVLCNFNVIEIGKIKLETALDIRAFSVGGVTAALDSERGFGPHDFDNALLHLLGACSL